MSCPSLSSLALSSQSCDVRSCVFGAPVVGVVNDAAAAAAVTAIHGAKYVAVRRNQRPGERLQQLPRVRNDASGADVSLCSRRRKVCQQVLASRAVLCHRVYRLRLHWHLHLASGPRATVPHEHMCKKTVPLNMVPQLRRNKPATYVCLQKALP